MRIELHNSYSILDKCQSSAEEEGNYFDEIRLLHVCNQVPADSDTCLPIMYQTSGTCKLNCLDIFLLLGSKKEVKIFVLNNWARLLLFCLPFNVVV